MPNKIQFRRGTTTQWNDADPILSVGELGYNTTLSAFKIGDGTNVWSDLDYYQNSANLTPSEINAIDIVEKGAADGVATLDGNSKLTLSQLPDVAQVTVHAVADQTARLALSVEVGDIAIQADNGQTYVLSATPASTNGNWTPIIVADPFPSHNTDDLTEGSTNKYFTNERAQDAVGLNVGTGLSYDDPSGVISVTANTYDAYGSASTVAGDLSTHISDTSTHGVSGDIVGTSDSQTLTNKTISLTSNTLSGTLTEFNNVLSDDDFAGLTTSQTLTNKTINLTSNILTGTTSEFNSALSDGDFATTEGSATLKNKTISYIDNTLTIQVANISDLTASASELNTLDGITASTAELNILDGVTATYDELNVLDGITASTAELNILDGVTANATEINLLDGITGTLATQAYVDAATAGLNVHDSVRAATTANVNLNNGLENGDTLDGVTLATNDRVLVKNQNTATNNGVYVVQASGAAVRATDYDSTPEVDAGDFIFVQAGTVNGKTGWVQTNTITTIGSDDIEFTQFSGAGTYTAGNGLTLTGTQFSINTGTTVDLSTVQTLTNKTLTSPTITGTGSIAGTFTGNITGNVTGNVSGNAGTVTNGIYSTDTSTVTNTMLAGSIANAKLLNSSITINSTAISLGASKTFNTPSLTWGDVKNGGKAVSIA